jgi:hypothetical protein
MTPDRSTVADTELAAAIRAAAVLPTRAWPPGTRDPSEVDSAQRRFADAAVAGELIYIYNGEHSVTIGRGRTDMNRLSDTGKGQIYRLPFLPHLVEAWHQTGHSCYAEAAADYIDSFVSSFTDLSANSELSSTLALGIRQKNIVQALAAFVDTPVFTDDLLARTVAFTAREAQYLDDHMSTTINWRVHNARDLLMVAVYLPFLSGAARWRRVAVDILNDAWFRQYLPDGVHYERNPVYHIGMARTFCLLYDLGLQMPELGLQMTLEKLAQAYEFAAGCSRPNGYLNALHDSQGDHVGHIDTATGQAQLAGHKSVNGYRIRAEFRRKYGLPEQLPATSQYFPDAGLGFFRTGWSEDDQYVVFDATRWGGGHCHLSRNAVQLHAYRRSMVIDPGWLSYSSDEWGRGGRATASHSTCNLNGWSQLGVDPARTRYHHAPGYDVMHSTYEAGYWETELEWTFRKTGRGIAAEHTRTLFWVHDRFCFVADSLARLPRVPEDPPAEQPAASCCWQLSPDADLAPAPDGSQLLAQWPEANLLMLFPIRPDATALKIHSGEHDPIRGWVPGEGEHVPAPMVELRTPQMSRLHDYFVTILVPSAGDTVPEVTVDAESPLGTVGHVRLSWADGTADEVHWGCNFGLMIGERAGIATDSSLVHLRRAPDNSVTSGCCVHGTYLRPHVDEVRSEPATFCF